MRISHRWVEECRGVAGGRREELYKHSAIHTKENYTHNYSMIQSVSCNTLNKKFPSAAYLPQMVARLHGANTTLPLLSQ